MKSFVSSMAIALCALASQTAHADEAAYEVFQANADRGTVVGRNTVTGTACSLAISEFTGGGFTTYTFHYSFSSAEQPTSSISPGHFAKVWFRNQLAHGGPGLFENIIGGNQTPYRMEVDYDADRSVTAFRYYWDGELDDECVIE
jgi:hypothetical protein